MTEKIRTFTHNNKLILIVSIKTDTSKYIKVEILDNIMGGDIYG